ncbi:MAG: hypothetical protein DME26_04010 [Verrucomicrobia bacterium]|nr:MAG: hypothetical protein DME26_04010 [Verrucomicrobiota bacterium]
MTAAPYALHAYGSATVADAAVTSQKLATGAVTSEKIAVSMAPQAGQVLSYNGTNLVWQIGAVNAWGLTGNSGTTAGANFLGTTDNRPLEFKVNRTRALRLEPGTNSPNIIGGFAGNRVAAGVQGATVSGGGVDGLTNSVTDDFGTVAGGALNQAGRTPDVARTTAFATVGGGYANLANAFSATIGGGYFNTAAGDLSVVCGGNTNSVTGSSSFVGGGDLNLVAGQNSAVVGGMDHLADAAFAFIGGGDLNTVNDTAGTVAGGGYNTSSFYGFVGGGYFNDATNDFAAVAGGTANIASGAFAFVGGGSTNTAFGTGATVPGGRFNIALGDLSFAAGNRARANHRGTFVWGDSSNADIGSTANDQFVARASGGVTFYSNAGASTGVRVNPGAGSWSNASDRNAKENFARVEGREVLERLAKVPIQTWNYKSQESSIRHIGPMAQDFRAAFKVGEDEKHISTVDADGVALAAIQGLHQVVKEKESKIASHAKSKRQCRIKATRRAMISTDREAE